MISLHHVNVVPSRPHVPLLPALVQRQLLPTHWPLRHTACITRTHGIELLKINMHYFKHSLYMYRMRRLEPNITHGGNEIVKSLFLIITTQYLEF